MKAMQVILTAALVIGLAPPAGSGEPPKDSPTDFQALVAQIEKDAEVRIKGDWPDSDVDERLKHLQYDAKSIKNVKAEINKTRVPLVRMYVAQKLLSPLLRAEPELVRQMLPVVEGLLKRFGRYRNLPKHSKGRLRRLKMPEFRKGMSPQARLRQIAYVQGKRDEKRAREMPIKQNNRLVYKLEKLYRSLQLLAGTAKEDESVLDAFADAMKRKQWIAFDIARAIAKSGVKMKPERVQTFYSALLEWANRVRYDGSWFENRGVVYIKPADNSEYARSRVYPGKELLECVNKLAPLIGKKPEKIPSEDDYRAHSALTAAKALLKSREATKLSQGVKRLEELIKRYPRTEFAAKARKLLRKARAKER